MRLIDADSVLKWFDEYWAMQKKLGRPSKQQRAIYMTMRSMVNSVKTVDAVPVRHGKWIKGSETKRVKENRYGVLFDAYYCSACESEAYWDSDNGQILFHYCPNCGARMDEE